METKYYFPIDSNNLPHYFGCACIKPGKYFSNKNQDFQNKFENFLIITTKMRTNETDCSLELVLTNEEKDKLIPISDTDDVFLLATPLPITRVKALFFFDEESKDRIQTIVNLGTAFIPPIASKVAKGMETIDLSNLNLPADIPSINWNEHLIKYDRILGGFALMRLSGEDYMNYSANYFSTLSFFNSVIETELINSNRNVNPIYHDIFIGKEKFKQLFPYLYHGITEDYLERLAREEKQKIYKNKITGLIDINQLDRASYILAALLTYGVGDEARRKKIDGLIANNFKGEIKPDKSEIISLCYGLNRGYSVFSNKYKVSGVEKTVKFKLDSHLDYYTIESIYQFVFKDILKSGEFPYLDSWCPKLNETKRTKKNEYLVLDKLIVGEKINVGSTKWWSNILQIYFQNEQIPLFKPFLEIFFNKVYSEVKDELQEELQIKNDEIQSLQKEIKKFNSLRNENILLQEQIQTLENESAQLNGKMQNLRDEKTKLYENIQNLQKENKDHLTLKDENTQLQSKIQNLQMEINNLKHKFNLFNEQKIEYAKNLSKQEDCKQLKSNYEEINSLINKIDKQTNIKDAKKMIKEFNSKPSNSDDLSFDEIK